MSEALDRFYLIVPDAGWVERLVPLGVRLVQLRLKDLPPESVREHIVRAQECCTWHAATLVVNDHWQEAIDLGCAWVHLGQEDLSQADMPALRKAGIKVGLSTHDHAELDRALSFAPDYVALGPVYPTLLKQMPWGPQGLERITEWKRLVRDIPLVGIGGLTPDRLPTLFAAGADSAAVVTDIVRAADPEARTREWLAATRQPA